MAHNSGHTNRLIKETSPYLLQHAHNPVDWYPWGDEAFAKARNENKLLFVSIGYSSCHWCHVMAHESFENEAIAAYLNDHYVAVKVDREERPDIDAVYMEAVQVMSGQGGWPLNVWLTPDGLPIFGGTYFPPVDAFHRPGFLSVLKRVRAIYLQDPEAVREQTEQMAKMLTQDLYDHLKVVSDLDSKLIAQAFSVYEQNYDPMEGGFSAAPKFPMPMSLEFLLNYYALSGNQNACDMVLNTLQKMIMGGLYDQLGGGFHRYSTDESWLVPHFEKMLYDNGLLLSVLADASQISKDSIYADAMDKTIAFLEREMRSPGGGFYSALDADSDGMEGNYYVWSYSELDEILTVDELQTLSLNFDIRPEGNWESRIILRRKESRGFDPDIPEFETIYRKLFAVRNLRVKPETDMKIILSWNAMALKGLCKAYRVSGKPHYKELAVDLGRFLTTAMSDGTTLYRIWTRGERKQPAFLDDYALFAEALAYLFEITGDEHYLDRSVSVCQKIISGFYDADKNGFYYTEVTPAHTPGRIRDTFDNAVPGATSAALAALQRVGHLTMKDTYTQITVEAATKLASTAAHHAASFGYFLQVLCRIIQPTGEIVVTGEEDERESFRNVWASAYRPYSILIMGNSFKNSLYPSLKNKDTIDQKPAAYVCENFTCRKPAVSVASFSELLVSGSVQ